MKSPKIVALIVGLLGIVSFAWALSIGSFHIALNDWLHLSSDQWLVISQIRLPRVLCAFVVGASLATAGCAFQSILHNPLADPYILGISAGAGLGAVSTALLGLALGLAIPLSVGAWIGACLTIALVFGIVNQKRKFSALHFILAGIMINALCSALTLLCLYQLEAQIRPVMMWLMGDVSQAGYPQLAVASTMTILGFFILKKSATALNIVALNDQVAQSVGIRVQRLRIVVFFAASLLTASAVSCAGVIGFMGLVIPHIFRLLLNDDFKLLLPFSWVGGGVFLVFADALSRQLSGLSELPIGVITSCIGAPLFLMLLLRKSTK